MLDYYGHIVSLSLLANLGSTDPALQDLQDVVKGEFSFAALGSLIDHLFEHADTTEQELTLLEQASSFWNEMRDYIIEVEAIRKELEACVLDPNQPGIVDRFNALRSRLLDDLTPKFTLMVAKLQVYYDSLQQLRYIPLHGQTQDLPVNRWFWRDLILSRRTGAMILNLVKLAQEMDSGPAQAFAYGAAACYRANMIGSCYLDRVVGGPRRSHLYRDRLASRTVGAWLYQQQPTLSLPHLRALLAMGPSQIPMLPDEINKLLLTALEKTYPAEQVPLFPDMKKAYSNLLHHLDLLSAFPTIPMPQPIDSTLTSRILAAGAAAYPVSAGNTPTPTPSQGQTQGGTPTWKWVVLGICIAIASVLALLGGLPSSDPYRSPFQHGGEDDLSRQLTSDDGLRGVNVLFQLHCQLYQAAMYAKTVLKMLGLLYPEPQDFSSVHFRQFLALTAQTSQPEYVFRRPIAHPEAFMRFPDSALEHPYELSYLLPQNATFLQLLDVAPFNKQETIISYGLSLWSELAHNPQKSEIASHNYNLDGDLGYKYPCWSLKPAHSIQDDPVSVDALPYEGL